MSNTPASHPDAIPAFKAPAAPMGIAIESVMEAYAKAGPPVRPEHVESVLWLFRYAKANKLPGNAAVGRLFTPPRDGSSISKLFAAKYGAELDHICADIEKMRSLLAQRADIDGEPIIKLPFLSEEIGNFAELVHATHSIGFIWGPNQSGKTTAIKAYAAAAKRRTFRIDMPPGGARTSFLDRCLDAAGLSNKRPNADKGEDFGRCLTRDTQLIIDEFHQTWVTGSLKVNTVETIRRWRDERGCSVLLVCTDTLERALEDRRFAGILDQLSNRGVLRQRIPTSPQPQDVAAIIEAYRLRPLVPGTEAANLVDAICAESGLGKLCKYLQVARYLAVRRKEVFTWAHFMAACADIAAWASGNVKEGV